MPGQDGNRQGQTLLRRLTARSAAIAACTATAVLLAIQPVRAEDRDRAINGSTGTAAKNLPAAVASGTVEQDVVRLLTDIREAEARVASLQRRLEMLTNNARVVSAPLQGPLTPPGVVELSPAGMSESEGERPPAADSALEPTRAGDEGLTFEWLIGVSVLVIVVMLVVARLGAFDQQAMRRILLRCAELHGERKRRARQEKRLHDHLRKIAALSKTPHPATRRAPQLRVVR